jgi:two-component system phosphate regulon sensor histidine kinase PhoR
MTTVTLAVVLGAIFIADPLLEDRAMQDARNELDAVAWEVASAFRGSDEDPSDLAARLAAEHAVRITVYGPDGAIVARTRSESGELGPAELARARRGELVASVTVDAAQRRWMHMNAALEDGTVVRVGRPFPPLSAARSTLVQVLVVAGIVAVLLAALLSEYFARTLGDPLRQMTATADGLRRGDFENRVRSRRQDELGALGSAIDQMADQLQERFDQVRREEEQLRTIVDAMVEGVLVTDAAGRIVLSNAALTRLAGRDVEGRTAVEAIRSAELHEAVRKAAAGQALEVDFEITVGGKRRSIAAQVAPLRVREGVVAVLHDVTQLKQADAVRRDFVANASHELRTPLTAIKGFAETLADGAMNDERMAKRFLQNISDNANRLHELVEDLLELSRAESPDSAFELEPVDVMQIAAKVVRGLESRAAEKAQQLVVEDSRAALLASADARALDQVLINLVENAIKYTPEGGRISVRARAEEERVILEVSDTGPGIPRQHLDRIFERFYRVDKGRARAQGGTGLGLSIVRHLVSRMGGEVSVSSTVGAGSTFRVSLAAATTEPVAASA